MPSERMLDILLRWVTPVSGKGALGQWRASDRQHHLDTEPGRGDNLNGRRAGGITRHPRGGYEQAFKPRDGWEGPLGIGCCCQPDSGKPTVRDERGACGNVSYGGTRHPPRRSKERVLETLRLRLCAPHFYPTERPARPRIWWGGSPHAVNCPIRTVSISDGRGGNKPSYART